MEAGQSQRSVHYVVSWTNAGKEWPDIVGDADVSMGAQYITWHKGGHVGHVTVIANATAAYVRGDAFALASYMLFPAAGASKYANRWIVIPKGASGYPTVSAGVRLKPAINALKPTGTLARVPNTVYGGQKVLGVQGKSSAGGKTSLVETLYGRAAGAPLPVAVVGTRGKSRFTVILSRWNERVRVAPPTKATPVSVVVATH